ncbi:MAG: hypothetical protein SGPRY_011721 [Prymnesium sp.]
MSFRSSRRPGSTSRFCTGRASWRACTTAANAAQWEGLQRALDLGLTRSIEVSNFDSAKLHRLMLGSTRVAPAVNQCQMSINGTIMHLNGALILSGGHDDATLSYCQSHSITCEAWGLMNGHPSTMKPPLPPAGATA